MHQFAEYIPFQIPMGKRTPEVLGVMGFDVYRADTTDTVADVVAGALDQAFFSNRAVAVLLSQRMIGRKNWSK